MAIGPIKQEPQYPFSDMMFKPRPCSRADKLAELDIEKQFEREMKRCYKRRDKPGFETIDNMRYQGGE